METNAPAAHIRYYLGFNLVPGIGPARLARLIERCGSVEAAWGASSADLLAAGLDPRTSAALQETRRTIDLDAALARVAEVGAYLLTRPDADYPELLGQIDNAPPLLYVRGALASVDSWSLAVVGTRTPTSYGREVTRQLVGELASNGVTIISGLAMGIDAVAHAAALDAGGRTLAVLGSGIDILSPERNQALARRIVQHGALITDYPLGMKPLPANFPPRNRIISGLAPGTLVIEAGEKSGAHITVGFALDQGRDVFAVPGSILSAKSKGTNALIRNGATPVTSAADVLEALNLQAAPVQQELASLLSDDPEEAALLECLSAEPQHADILARAAGLPAAVVAARLTLLELKGQVRRVGNMEYVRAR